MDVLQPLTSNPDHMIVDSIRDDRGILITVTVEKEDMGRLIGKGGETIRAIRQIMHQYGHKIGEKISVKLNEPA